MMFSDFLKKMIFANMVEFGEGRVKIMGVPGAIVSMRMMSGMLLDTYDEIGKKAFDIFFDAGEQHGKLVGQMAKERFKMRPDQFYTQFIDSGDMLGLGKIVVKKFDSQKNTAIVHLMDSAMAKEVLKSRGRVKFPVDHLFCGIVSGIFNAMFKKNFEVKEVSCIAMGAPVCEFVVKPKGR
jgi:predicted hydrocarbon binding protein